MLEAILVSSKVFLISVWINYLLLKKIKLQTFYCNVLIHSFIIKIIYPLKYSFVRVLDHIVDSLLPLSLLLYQVYIYKAWGYFRSVRNTSHLCCRTCSCFCYRILMVLLLDLGHFHYVDPESFLLLHKFLISSTISISAIMSLLWDFAHFKLSCFSYKTLIASATCKLCHFYFMRNTSLFRYIKS